MLSDAERSLVIDAVLRGHPYVRDSATVACKEVGRDSRFIAFLEPEVELAIREGLGGDPAESWRRIWNMTYSRAGSSTSPDLGLNGWISSYTGQPIPGDDMRQWVLGSVASVSATGARTYLEVGCGMGLLLRHLAPASDRYLGIDAATAAVQFTRERVRRLNLESCVEVEVGKADNIAKIVGDQRFECVIINSVAQYFSDEDYLTRALRAAISVTSPGGYVFVGDIRHKSPAKAFYASVLQRPGLSAEALELGVRFRAAEEQELLVDPGYFTKLRVLEPAITGIQFSLKPDGPDNEPTRFRYDVLLQVKGPEPEKVPEDFLDWDRHVGSVARLREVISTASHEFVIEGIANSRIAPFLSLLDRPGESCERPGVRVDEISRIAKAHAWKVHLDWSYGQIGAGRLRALFHHRAHGTRIIADSRPSVVEPVTNDPRRAAVVRLIALTARSWVRHQMDPALLPDSIRGLPKLPVSTGGGVDRGALEVMARIIMAE